MAALQLIPAPLSQRGCFSNLPCSMAPTCEDSHTVPPTQSSQPGVYLASRTHWLSSVPKTEAFLRSSLFEFEARS